MATDSSLKSELSAMDGSAAPLWPSVPAPVSVSAAQRTFEAQVFRRIAGHLPDGLAGLPGPGGLTRLLLLLLGLARGQDELEVDELVVAGGVEDRFLRALREGRELGADHVAAVLGNVHLPRAGDVGGGGVALAGEGVLRGDGDAGQRDVAAFYRAMQLAAGTLIGWRQAARADCGTAAGAPTGTCGWACRRRSRD